MATAPVPSPVAIDIVPMRRRHLKHVLQIEAQVYPRPWSASLFLSELALRSSRAYLVAKAGGDGFAGARSRAYGVLGYAGLMMTMDDAHITTIAVDPAWHRQKIGTRLLVALAREAIRRGATSLTLEVRASNEGAQAMYRNFGFVPVGVRRGYYIETSEDAIVMWAHEVHLPSYAARLDAIDREAMGWR